MTRTDHTLDEGVKPFGDPWSTDASDLPNGNLAVQERDSSNLPQVTYTRGDDLSGTLQGAGGIGGLLARTENWKLDGGEPFPTAFYHSDGNGNVTFLMQTNGLQAAKYLYDPYGNMLAMSGPLAAANKYRFSSKEWDDNAGLYYYLYRFYDPNLQRWVNRDPLAEFGWDLLLHRKGRPLGGGSTVYVGNGPNLFLFVADSPLGSIDPWGLDNASCDACWNQYRQRVHNIAELELACLDATIAQCLGKSGRCVIIGAGICGGITIALEDAAAAQLAGCLSGCQPTTCPWSPPHQPPRRAPDHNPPTWGPAPD